MAASVQTDPESDRAPLCVVIVYDDRLAYRRALRTLARIIRELGDDCLALHPLPWRFDVLADGSWRDRASADIGKAEIVMVSTNSEGDFPEAIRAWLPGCLSMRCDTTGLIVAMLGTPDQVDERDSPRFRFLENAARQAGWAFLAPNPATLVGAI